MSASQRSNAAETSVAQDLVSAGRYYIGRGRGLLIVATVVITAGVALNWSWLAAIGLAPLLLGVLPCVAICAVGLCIGKAAVRPGPSDPAAAPATETHADGGSPVEGASDRVAPIEGRRSNTTVTAEVKRFESSDERRN